MRLLVLNWLDRENPQAGGAEVHLHETFGRLARAGDDVTLVSSGWPGAPARAELGGIEVHRVGGRHTYPLRVAAHVRRALAERSFDLVVEDLNKVPVFAPTWAPAPVVLLVHHLFGATVFREARAPLALTTWLLERPIPAVYRGIPVVAVSESTREDLVRRGLAPERIQIIPNGVDTDRLIPGSPEDRFPEPTLLYLGRLKRYKRVDLVIRAVAELRRRGIEARLLVAGKGDRGPALEREARGLGLLPDAVRFLGFVPEAEKRELLRRAWVHVFTSPKEGWGIANLEAAACGTPTVASDSPGLRDSVRHGETGFLVPHGDVLRLADRIGLLLANPDLRDRLGRAARTFALEYSWDRTARRMAEALREVAGRSPAD